MSLTDLYSNPYPQGFTERKPGKPRLFTGFQPGEPTQVGWGDEGDATDSVDPNTPQWGPMSPGASGPPPTSIPLITGFQQANEAAKRNIPGIAGIEGAIGWAGEQMAKPGQLVSGIEDIPWGTDTRPPVPADQRHDVIGPRPQHGWQQDNPISQAMDRGKLRQTIDPTGAMFRENIANPLNYLGGAGERAVPALARGAAKVGEAIADPGSIPGMIARGPLQLAMGAAGGAGKAGGKLSADAEQLAWLKSPAGGRLTDEQAARRIAAIKAAEAAKAAEPPKPPGADLAQRIGQDPAAAQAAAQTAEQERVAFNAGRQSRAKNPGDVATPARTVRQRAARATEQAAVAPKVNVLPAARVKQLIEAVGGDTKTLAQHFAKALDDMTPEQVQQQMAAIRQVDPKFFENAGVPGLVTEAAASVKMAQPVNRNLEQAAAGLLSKAAPRYGYGDKQFGTAFESEADRLIYTVTKSDGRGGTIIQKDNKTHAKGIQLLRDAGITDDRIIQRGQAIRDGLKGQAKNGKTGAVLKVAAADQGDTVQAKQSVAKAAQKVAEQRDAQKAAAKAQATGKPAEPAEPPKPPEVDTATPMDEADRTVVKHLPSLPSDIQEAAVSSLGRGLTKAQVATHLAGGVPGFAFGYNQDERDDTKTRILKGLLYGEAGFRAAHVVSGGKLTGLPNRAMEMYRRQLLSPKTVIVPKIGQDATSLILAPITRGISATLERGPISGVQEMVKNYGGYWHGAQDFVHSMPRALDPRAALQSGTYGERGSQAAHTLASPGEYTGSIWTRLISGVTSGVEQLHESGVRWANAPLIAKKEAELWKTASAEESIGWLKKEMNPELLQELETYEPEVADKIKSGLWTDPEVGLFAQNAHVNQQLIDYTSTLPEPAQVAKDWTLMNPIGKGIRAGSKGQGGIVARTGSGLVGFMQDVPILNPKILGAQVPIGKMLFPFKTVVSNAADQFVNFIPLLGEVNTRWYPEIRPSVRIAKQVVGGAAIAGLLGIVGDNATDGGPQDKTKLIRWIDQGNVPNSFRAPDGMWRPIKDLPAPMQVLMRTAGALNGYKRDQQGGKPVLDQTVHGLREFMNAISDVSVFQSLLNAANLMNSTGTSAQREASFMLGGVTGSNLAVPATAERPNVADTSGDITANLRSRLPGIEKGVPDKLGPTAKPMPNPDEGWKSLLGNFAGKAPLQDKVAEVYYDDKYGPGLSINKKTIGSGKSILNLPPDVQRATFERAAQLLQERTPIITGSDTFKKADDGKKKEYLSKIQSDAHSQAFWEVVNNMDKEKFMASLPPEEQSVFRSEDVAHTMAQSIAKTPFATQSGKPYDEGNWKADQALLKVNEGKPAAQQSPKVKELKKAAEYARAASINEAIKSPGFPDWVRHAKFSGLDDSTWKALDSGQVALIGKPGAMPVEQQLTLYGTMLWYAALPAGDPRKESLKPKMDMLHRQSNMALLKKAESPVAVAKDVEAQAA